MKNLVNYFMLSLGRIARYKTQSSLQKAEDSVLIAKEMRQALDTELARWYPASLDPQYGGYFTDFNYKWKRKGLQNKMIVTQARHVWTASNAARFFENKAFYLDIAAHGFTFLKEKMWDPQFGGFYGFTDPKGQPLPEGGLLYKTGYGNAFGLYGVSAYYKTSQDPEALGFAKAIFHWLEKNSHDPMCGGYFQFMDRTGKPFEQDFKGSPPKDYNSLLHMLESLTELYSIWKDPAVRERLVELLSLFQNTLCREKGYLRLFFNRDWSSFKDGASGEGESVSFGHDLEAAYLMMEAAEALGYDDDKVMAGIAKTLIDHALTYGIDPVHGGVFDEGVYRVGASQPTISKPTKEWWVQVEALKAILIMADLFPDDPQGYYEAFCNQWHYCKTYVMDHQHGGWYFGGLDGNPDNVYSPKGTIWKGNYHTARALMHCIKQLSVGKKLNLHL